MGEPQTPESRDPETPSPSSTSTTQTAPLPERQHQPYATHSPTASPTPAAKSSVKESAENPKIPAEPKTEQTPSIQESWLRINRFLETHEARALSETQTMVSASATPEAPELLPYPEVPLHSASSTSTAHQTTQPQHLPPPPTTHLQPTCKTIPMSTPTLPISRKPPSHYMFTTEPRVGATSTQIPEVSTLRTMNDRILATFQTSLSETT